jgi:AcrR family transcriptional regulator
MDKRIIKTQKNLKNTLRQMIMEKPFEKISVTELCKRAKTSRITFYTYYSDKYDLLNQCLEDIQKEAVARFEELEAENPEHRLNVSCQHFVMVLIEVMGPFVDTEAQKDSKAATLFYHFATQNLRMFKKANASQFKTHYNADQLDAFISYGLWGFVFANKDKYDREQTVEDAKRLIDDLLASPIFEKEH